MFAGSGRVGVGVIYALCTRMHNIPSESPRMILPVKSTIPLVDSLFTSRKLFFGFSRDHSVTSAFSIGTISMSTESECVRSAHEVRSSEQALMIFFSPL